MRSVGGVWHRAGRGLLATGVLLSSPMPVSAVLQDQAASGQTLPDGSRAPQGVPGSSAASACAKGRFIVKFKPTLTQSAHALLAQKRRFQSALTDGSDSLDRLNAQVGVLAARGLFVNREHQTTAQAQTAQTQRLQSVKSRYARRSRRIPPGAVGPDLTNAYIFEVDETADIEAVCRLYRADPHVEYAQPDYEATAFFTPNDPYYHSSGSWGQPYGDLWGLHTIQAGSAWDLAQGQGIVVAVLDTGLDSAHPDIAANVWVNPGEVPGNGLDDDANGFIDDVQGWDFAYGDNDPADGNGHGTHVAGTIAAVGSNGLGMIGVAPQAKVMPVKGLNDSGSGSSSDLALGLVYAANQGADVINNSWGCGSCPSNPVVEDAVRTAHSLGAVVVFAAGNSSSEDVSQRSPQNMVDPKPVVVAASTHLDERANFSSYGALVDVAAPGGEHQSEGSLMRSILSLQAQGTTLGTVVSPGYVRLAGTSMAAPHVAGLAALVLSRAPDWTPDEVLTAVRATADDVSVSGFDKETGYGRINAARAATLVTSPCVAFLHAPAPGSLVTEPATITIEGTADCRSFQGYTLEVRRSTDPATWSAVSTGTAPVVRGTLGTFDASTFTGIELTFRLTVRNTLDQAFLAYSPVQVIRGLHSGWPIDVNVFEFPAALGDLDRDGTADLVFAVFEEVHAVKHTGQPLAGWPIDLGELSRSFGTSTNPVIGDLDGDGAPEVVAGAPIGQVYALHGDGTIVAGWPAGPPSSVEHLWITEDPLMVDLDGDGRDEVVVGWNEVDRSTLGSGVIGHLYVFRGDGTTASGWPQRLPLNPSLDWNFTIQAAAGDLTGDGEPELVVVQSRHQKEMAVTVFDRFGRVLPGWPQQLRPREYARGLVLGDLNGDGRPEIVVATTTYVLAVPAIFLKTLYAWQADGTTLPGWPVQADFLFPDTFGELTPPTLGDLDRDHLPEVIVGVQTGDTNYSKVAVFKSDGSLLTGWPVQLDNRYVTTSLIADADGDGWSDLIMGSQGAAYALDRAGHILNGWPRPLPGYSSSPTTGDVDGDGKLELLVGGGLDTPLFLYDLPGPAAPHSLQWAMSGHDAKHSGLYTLPPPAPDLIPLGLFASPWAVAPGSEVFVWDAVKNGGDAAAASFTVTFFLYASDGSGRVVAFPATRTAPDLGAGATHSASTVLTVPADAGQGVYFFCAVLDLANTVNEANELNNYSCSWALRVAPADLVVSSVVGPGGGQAGRAIRLTARVTNPGAGAISSFPVGFYLSSDAAITTADLRLGQQVVTALAPGAASDVVWTGAIPAALPVGLYYMGAIADDTNTRPESNEANNGRAGTVVLVAPGSALIVDNAAAGVQNPMGGRSFTGTWCASSAPGFFGVDALVSCGSGLDTYRWTYRWTPAVPAQAKHDVYLWWTASATQGTAVPITVVHAKGSTTKYFNQRTNGGRWVYHGRYTLKAGMTGYVVVTDQAGPASADAVLFVRAR